MSDLEQKIRGMAKDGSYLCMLGGGCIDLNEIADRIAELERQLNQTVAQSGVWAAAAGATDAKVAELEAALEQAKEVKGNLERQNAELRKDAERLDWLDATNKRTNERYGTVYGWKFDINHNRAALTDHNWPARSIREAIDAAMPTAADQKGKASIAQTEKPLTGCAANRDGECFHSQCPQLRDGEPMKSGRHCPLDTQEDEE